MEMMLKSMGVDTEGVKQFAEGLKAGLERMDKRIANIETFMGRIEVQLQELRNDLISEVEPAGGTYHDLVVAAEKEVAAAERNNDNGKRR